MSISPIHHPRPDDDSASRETDGVTPVFVAPERVIVFARFPESGRVKTRLIPALGPDGAAQLQKIDFGECAWNLLPLIEKRPLQGRQAEHVDNIRLRNEIDGAGRIPA